MKVICKIIDTNAVSSDIAKSYHECGVDKGIVFDELIIGEEYTVYGLVFMKNKPWYLLCYDENDYFPTHYPVELFEVIDKRVSKYWQLADYSMEVGQKWAMIVIREWAENRMFYENLSNDEEEELMIFQKYKKLMDEEFENIAN